MESQSDRYNIMAKEEDIKLNFPLIRMEDKKVSSKMKPETRIKLNAFIALHQEAILKRYKKKRRYVSTDDAINYLLDTCIKVKKT
jgi:hypothetical protein